MSRCGDVYLAGDGVAIWDSFLPSSSSSSSFPPLFLSPSLVACSVRGIGWLRDHCLQYLSASFCCSLRLGTFLSIECYRAPGAASRPFSSLGEAVILPPVALIRFWLYSYRPMLYFRISGPCFVTRAVVNCFVRSLVSRLATDRRMAGEFPRARGHCQFLSPSPPPFLPPPPCGRCFFTSGGGQGLKQQ